MANGSSKTICFGPVLSFRVHWLSLGFATTAVASVHGEKIDCDNHVDGLVRTSRQAVIHALGRKKRLVHKINDNVVISGLVCDIAVIRSSSLMYAGLAWTPHEA